MACLCSHLPLRLISWISMTKIRPTRRMGQVIPTVVDVNQKARDHWIITFLWVLLSIYKEPVKPPTLEDYTQSPTEKDFAVSYYPTNTCQASYSDVQLISKIRWVFVQSHATTFWCCQLSAYIYRKIRMIYDLLCSILPTTLDLFGVATLAFSAKGVEAIESSNSPAYLLRYGLYHWHAYHLRTLW